MADEESKPSAADYANMAKAACYVVNNMNSALDFDKARGLCEPAAKDFAEQCIKKACDAAPDYLKEVKPEIVEDMKKCSKKCGGACGGKQQQENKKKGGSCGGVASASCSSACAAGPGFQPSEAVSMRAQLEAAKAVAESALSAVAGTLAAAPSTTTTAPGALAGPTIVIDVATLTELGGAITSLIMTQEALISRMGVGL